MLICAPVHSQKIPDKVKYAYHPTYHTEFKQVHLTMHWQWYNFLMSYTTFSEGAWVVVEKNMFFMNKTFYLGSHSAPVECRTPTSWRSYSSSQPQFFPIQRSCTQTHRGWVEASDSAGPADLQHFKKCIITWKTLNVRWDLSSRLVNCKKYHDCCGVHNNIIKCAQHLYWSDGCTVHVNAFFCLNTKNIYIYINIF